MKPFTVHTGVAAALLRDNIDTDAIIPSREMKTVGKTGLAEGLFANWRYADVQTRRPDPEFVLNRPEQAGTSVLLAGRNFGCGSSREHAVWALAEWGIRAIVAPSFGAIFFDNCLRNGLLPLVLPETEVRELAEAVQVDPQARPLTLDLSAGRLLGPWGLSRAIELAAEDREMLLTGLDPIERTRQLLSQIEAFEAADRRRFAWLYLS
ncbi:3-isopropylmalate dehydratase small subunit [Paucibacter sp. JuS9]|uniref:3-isopropylmalate dehydratase small subunit n=1 Tax=Paucibacter sp. JuS9 TaxID=3228748 RepID=UPI0037582C97